MDMAKEVKVKVLIVAMVTALLVVGQTTDKVAEPEEPKALTPEDRGRIRQLETEAWKIVAAIRQARIDQLEAEKKLEETNRGLGELVRQFVVTYKAEGYQLSPEFQWVKPKTPAQPQLATGPATPAAQAADGEGEK